MMIFEDGTTYPSGELLAFRAMKMCGDCPLGTLDCAGSNRALVPFAVNRGEIVTVAPESVFDFPYSHRVTEQCISVHCAYGHIGRFTLEFRGRIYRAVEDGAEALRHFLKVHPDHRQQHTAIARFVIEKIDYYGLFPEAGDADVGMFSDERLTDDRVQFPETCREFNSRPTTALVRVARHYIKAQPRVQRASLLRTDSYGITIAAENEFDQTLLRLDFETRAESETEARIRMRERIAPGYDARRLEAIRQHA